MNWFKLRLYVFMYLAPRLRLHQFREAVAGFPEIVGVYRTSGDLDYVLRARVFDVKAYDRLYQRLIARVKLADVSASFVMEEIKETTQIPLSALGRGAPG